jgi:hypothetical protein
MSKQPFNYIDALLIAATVGLTALLIYVIWEPGQVLAKIDAYKWESRARMTALRTAEVQHFKGTGRYARDLDSLLTYVRDSIPAERRDSLFTKLRFTRFRLDSLRNSPMGHLPYQLLVNDTSAIHRYTITCPDGFGYIGSLSNPDEHNKASWEQ